MFKLDQLRNSTQVRRVSKRVGRGIGSGKGKTCGRGEKGAGSRAGYKRRLGYEGGQFRLYMKVPIRGFSNVRFRKAFDAINLDQIEKMFKDGDVVSQESLMKNGFLGNNSYGLKILGKGEITKKVTIEAHSISQGARDKLQKAKVSFKILGE